TRLDLLGRKNETRQPCPLLSIGVGERALRFTGTLTCQVFFRSVSFRMRNRGRVSGLQAALSGSNPKAPGFAGGYLLSWEFPRLCRGGSKSLTFPTVAV